MLVGGSGHAPGAKAADGVRGPEGHVRGVGGLVLWSDPMRDTGAAPGSGLTAGTGPSAAPGRSRGQRQLDRAVGHDLD